jgi:uncharacterized protein (TIGR02271 family)
MAPGNTGLEAVVIGLFSRSSDARRALDVLREHHFDADEASAAFRQPALTRAESGPVSAPGRGSGQWFGQLREIYHGDDGIASTQRTSISQAEPRPGASEFESTLARLGLSSQGAVNNDLNGVAAVVTVNAGARNPEARTLLEQYGARIVHSHRPERAAVTDLSPGTVVTSEPFTAQKEAEPGHIQLFGEVLRVRKEKVAAPDVQVRKESVTHMETVQVPVTREHLVVEHANEQGFTAREDAIRLPLSEERVHIDKDTVLREEYRVGKRDVTQNEAISGRVRRERLLIDDPSTANNQRDDD